MAPDPYSLVMSGFAGQWPSFAASATTAFGRDGLDVFSLTVLQDHHLPAEIADDLRQEDAEQIAAVLRAVGAQVEVVSTSGVGGVRHRAAEVWPTRTACGCGFTEIDGMVLGEEPLSARENLEHLRRQGYLDGGWQYERGANHMHGDMSLPARELVRQEVGLAAHLEAALREAYPERRFVLSHIPGSSITFYQWAEGAAGERALHTEPRNGKVWCQTCQHSQPYHPHNGPDAEFPLAEWGTCTECGIDVLVRVWEVTTEVGV